MDALKSLRFVVPSSIRQSVRALHRQYVFNRAMKRFVKAPEAALNKDSRILTDLIYGWGNEGWSALEEYLAACLRHAYQAKGDILECGSGLSTLLLGVMAQRCGRRLWSLENNDAWGCRVRQALRKYRIDSVNLVVRPLKDFGDFTWYDAPLETLPKNFALVICDGPPGSTRGGRYGLVPVMKERLLPGALILLDDGGRSEEQSIAARWANELGAESALLGSRKPYIQLRIPAEDSVASRELNPCPC